MIEDNNTFEGLSGKVRELQNEINCMIDSRDFKDAEPVRREQFSHVPSELASFLFFLVQENCLAAQKNSQPDIWNTRGMSGNVFANSPACSSASCLRTVQSSDDTAAVRVPAQQSTEQPVAGMSDQDRDTIPTPRFPRSPSAGNSFQPMEGRNFKNHGADQQRLQISELHFDKFPNPQTFSCWRMRFKTEVCSCSVFTTEPMLWIKEVEMPKSVDVLKSSCPIQVIIPFPDFELLDARTASALNKIINNSYFKKRVRLEEQKAQKQDRFLRGREIAYLIYDYFRVTGVNHAVLDYADLLTVVLRNDNIQEFDTRWDGILLSMTKIPPDDILESLYKLRMRESEKLKTVLELYNLEIHQQQAKPGHNRLKTMVKRSIEQELRSRKLAARNGRIESNILVKNQKGQRRVHKRTRRLLAMASFRAVFERRPI